MRNRIIITLVILASLAAYECASKPQKHEGGVAPITYEGKPVTKISCSWSKKPHPCMLLQDGELVFLFE